MADQEIATRLRELRRSLAPDLYLPMDFIPWDAIDQQLDLLSGAIAELQQRVDNEDQSVGGLAESLMADPGTLELMHLLFVAPYAVGFADGNELPETPPKDRANAQRLARLLTDLGIWRLLPLGADVRTVARASSVARDARRRGFRRTATIEKNVRATVRDAVAVLNAEYGIQAKITRSGPEVLRGRADAIVSVDNTLVGAVASVFQVSSGGSQQTVLSSTLPSLQAALDSIPMSLIVIVDGRGIAQAPDRVLSNLLSSVAACMTLREAQDGRLAEALHEASRARGLRPGASAPVDEIIRSGLRVEGAVTASDLPLPGDQARLALATFARTHSELALALSPRADELRWQRAELIGRIQAITPEDGSSDLALLFGELLNARETRSWTPLEPKEPATILQLEGDGIAIPNELFVRSIAGEPSENDLRVTSADAMVATPDSRYAVILADMLYPFSLQSYERIQRQVATNVVVLDAEAVSALARRGGDVRVNFAKEVLAQSDLTKISPYVLRSATPPSMFYGRETEEATLANAASSTSVALLGGRRIGKTSMLREAQRRLQDAEYQVHYLDCQTVRTWQDFGELAQRRLGVDAPPHFRPAHLFTLVDNLRRSEPGTPLIIMLDEIDQLIAWDEERQEDSVPEAFFRTCRSISQEGLAQFIFSGERTISRKIWDPQSPHWNFCQPIQLRQLSRNATDRLISEPLAALGVALLEPEDFLERVWQLTSGHPQIVQYLGDSVVRRLNDRPGDKRDSVGRAVLDEIASTYEYREHYLETYWGQSTDLERQISRMVAKGVTETQDLIARLEGARIDAGVAQSALRMLELYGILTHRGGELELRAKWFADALAARTEGES